MKLSPRADEFNSIDLVVRTDAVEQNGVLAFVFHELEDDAQIITCEVMECGGKAEAATPLSSV